MVPGPGRIKKYMCYNQSPPMMDEKSDARGAENGPICMGILATLGSNTEFAPRGEKKVFFC